MEVSMHVTEQCNLNCKSCLHMIPLSDNYYYPIEGYIRDNLKLLANHKNIVDKFNIMGGEPTLHPHILSIIYVTREILTTQNITLSTNGTNIEIFKNKYFVDALKRTNTCVAISEYPYCNDADEKYNTLHKVLEDNGISYSYSKIPRFMTQPFVKSVNNDINQDKWCKSFYYCTMLKNGRLYICHLAAYIDVLKTKFPEISWIQTDNEMFVDLNDYSLTDADILNRMKKLCSICNHCAELNRGWVSDVPDEMIDWTRSDKDKFEWIKE